MKLKFASEQQSDLPPLKKRIKRLVDRTLGKFKKITNTNEFEQFSAICAEAFSIASYIHTRQQLEQSPVKTVPAKANFPDGKKSDCIKCAVLRKRLRQAVALRKAQHERDKRIISTLRAKLKSKPTVCVLNQRVKRKDLKIEQLKEKSIILDVENLKRNHQVAIKN